MAGETCAIGIDWGTTNARVAVWRDGRAECVPNAQGCRQTPSCVAFTNAGCLFGDAASRQVRMMSCGSSSSCRKCRLLAQIAPTQTVFHIKRLLGSNLNDPQVQQDVGAWPFKVVADPDGRPLLEVEHRAETKQFAPEELAAMVLAQMRDAAQEYLGEARAVTQAVIAVPEHFDTLQRQAVKDAGAIAGLQVLRVAGGTAAAAMAFDVERPWTAGGGQRNVLVFDLGGGTCDVSLLTVESGIHEVLAVAGDNCLGGLHFDRILAAHLVEEFKRRTGRDISRDPRAMRRLLLAAERAKRELSASNEAAVVLANLHEGVDFSSHVSRALFEELCAEAFSRCLAPVERVLQDARMDKGSVDDVVLIGGSCHIPKVRQLLQAFFNGAPLWEPQHATAAEHATACGAAVLAAILSGDSSHRVQDKLLLEGWPKSLGIETAGGVMATLISRNTTIPTKKEQVFDLPSDNEPPLLKLAPPPPPPIPRPRRPPSPPAFSRRGAETAAAADAAAAPGPAVEPPPAPTFDSQRPLTIKVYEGERASARDNMLLGEIRLVGFPRGSPAQVSLVTDIDAPGCLNIWAFNHTPGCRHPGTKISRKFQLAGGCLGGEALERMMRDASRYRAELREDQRRAGARAALQAFACRAQILLRMAQQQRGPAATGLGAAGVAVSDAVAWLDRNQLAEVDEFEFQLQELKAAVEAVLPAAAATEDAAVGGAPAAGSGAARRGATSAATVGSAANPPGTEAAGDTAGMDVDGSDWQCRICLAAEVDAAMKECGHTLCRTCAAASRPGTCPFCRAPSGVIRLFRG